MRTKDEILKDQLDGFGGREYVNYQVSLLTEVLLDIRDILSNKKV